MQLIATFLLLCCPARSAPAVNTSSDADLRRLISSLTIEEKVGQLFMIGAQWRLPSAEKQISEYHFGNVYLGHDDVTTSFPGGVVLLTSHLQDLALKYNKGIPLLIATDQEGGAVDRLKAGFVEFPSQRALGIKGADRVRRAAAFTGQQMRAVGIHVNFAPVLDVDFNPAGPLSYRGRLYSRVPQKVAELAAGAVEGYRQEKVIACAKHFPSYGTVYEDAHQVLPRDASSKETLMKTSLLPFATLIRQGRLRMIMTSHIEVPALEPEAGLSASLSKNIVTKFLRGELGFDGVAVTDGLNMQALQKKGWDWNAIKAVEAGNDLLFSSGKEADNLKAYRALVEAFRSGRLPMERLDESVMRILKLKREFVSFSHPQAEYSKVADGVNTPAQRAFVEELKH